MIVVKVIASNFNIFSKSLELCLTQDSTDFMITEVISISHEQESRINFGVLNLVEIKHFRKCFPRHTMTTLDLHQVVKSHIVGAYHTTFNSGHMMTEVKTKSTTSVLSSALDTVGISYTM